MRPIHDVAVRSLYEEARTGEGRVAVAGGAAKLAPSTPEPGSPYPRGMRQWATVQTLFRSLCANHHRCEPARSRCS